ncbi:MAG: hypothetical protein N2559_13110, partial [Anaerolineae bacterium]|nr:hypothetical protein [Anaerolineae bacterium]
MNAHFFRTIGKLAGLFTLLMLLVLLASAAPTATFAAPKVTISETFRNGTAPNWTLIGSACLTANNTGGAACSASPNNEGNGNGWLRLTSATGNQAGSAIYNTAFPSTDGVRATFTYATYGGSGADGFSFYLIDGATAAPTVGAPGGSLGYSRDTGAATPGVTNGYVGIGFDEHGNFSNTGAGDCNPSCPGQRPNSVTIRGSGNLNTGFNYLTRGSVTIPTGSRAGAKRARITISAGATKYITVEIDSGSGFQTIINNFNLTTAIGQAAMPATFK